MTSPYWTGRARLDPADAARVKEAITSPGRAITVLERMPLSALSENLLLRGHGDLTLSRCACGSWLAADKDVPDAVIEAVSRHNETPSHTTWRRSLGL